MVLETQKPTAYNEMLGRVSKQSTLPFQPAKEDTERSAKRQKISHAAETSFDAKGPSDTGKEQKAKFRKEKIEDSQDEAVEDAADSEEPLTQRTDIEQSLPHVKTDKEAIEQYEQLRAAEGALSQELRDLVGNRKWVAGKSSIYVDAFNLALDTVLEEESHLFDEAENAVFRAWRELGYEAQYLYVRLFLRKTAAWHRINRLGYYSDIADMNKPVSELFQVRPLPRRKDEVRITPGELAPPDGYVLEERFTFADKSEEHITSLEEASSLLLLDELKTFAKEAKAQGKNKSELLRAFRRSSGNQSSLGHLKLQRSDTEESAQSNQSEGREDSPSNTDSHYVRKILSETGRCIRLSSPVLRLFERVHLVFYRSTEWNENSLTTIILARVARRNYPDYIVSRSSSVFPSRSLLLEFEASLRTQFRVDSILEGSGVPTKERLQEVLDLFEDVLPRWRTLLQAEQKREDSIYATGEGAYLRRLSPAWVYTRIVHKGAYVLGVGKSKQHLREHSILGELLDQRLFHASRRGAWYQRKALLEEHYMHALQPVAGRTEDEQKKHWRRVALDTCEKGLQDNLVHVIYHHDLQKRITKLERRLKVPKRQQHDFGHALLSKPLERTVHGVRIDRQPTSTADRRGAKTVWLDPADPAGAAECGVEAMCLSHYRAQGWRGFHSEGGIVRTLFALLMYDVLFVYVPNVFQTPFQTCPLDLHTDGFFGARMGEVNARLAQLANGRAEEILCGVWEREGARRTCAVGLDWSFDRDDLCEIVRCFEGAALATVCKVMAQEYAQRGGGVPDLFLWRVGEDGRGEVCFAEVKSENDRLSDTQRLWMHVLAAAGIRVELCLAVASEVRVLE